MNLSKASSVYMGVMSWMRRRRKLCYSGLGEVCVLEVSVRQRSWPLQKPS